MKKALTVLRRSETSRRIANLFGPTRSPGIQRFIDDLLSHWALLWRTLEAVESVENQLQAGEIVREMESRYLQQNTVMEVMDTAR